MNAIEWPIDTYNLSKLLGLNENTIRVKKKQLENILIEGEDFSRDNRGKRYVPPWAVIWHRSGATKLALRSRSTKARAFLEDEHILERVEVADESKTVEMICHAIEGFTEVRQQYPVGPYKVDIYLPDLGMAVECDERGHASYSPLKEIVREQFIVQSLACTFERYDPAHPNQVGDIINAIFKAILKGSHVYPYD